MKRKIRSRLSAIILAAMVVSLVLNYFLQIGGARRGMRSTSNELFWQIGQILRQNEEDAAKTQEEFMQNCLIRAKAAAYIVQHRPEIIGDLPEMQKVADLLQIDEFHLFDAEGNLYAGSQPKYYGMNFNSGEQMQFFLPMLEDRLLELCQEITPNTAEQKLMQYAAVWREDGKEIVQIGMEPRRVLESMSRNELSYIFSLLTADKGAVIFAVDPASFEVLGSTNPDFIHKTVREIGLSEEKVTSGEEGLRAVVMGDKSYCVFSPMGSVILGRICSEESLYQDVYKNSLMLGLYLLLIALVMIGSISTFLDHYIVSGISAVNEKLQVITEGDLDTRIDVQTTPEFAKLSTQINRMIGSLLDTTNKMSTVLEIASIPVGVYEYRPGMRRVMATRRSAEILGLYGEEAERVLSDQERFERMLQEIRRHPVEPERGIYRLPGDQERFIRMESIPYEHYVLGIVMDVTDDMLERRRIERERDIDLLTDLYNRRALCRFMEERLGPENCLEQAVFVIADADRLKQVNDRYGHENGDRYLRGLADILREQKASHKVAARLGGDEFALLIYGCESRIELETYIRGLGEASGVHEVELSNGERIPVCFSIGYAFYPEEGANYDELLQTADRRMYENKKAKQ